MVAPCLRGLTAPYLSDDCQLVTEVGHRYPSVSGRIYYLCSFSDRSFTVAGPPLWNNLPVGLRQWDISWAECRRLLKTFLFRCDCSALWPFVWMHHLLTNIYFLPYSVARVTSSHPWMHTLNSITAGGRRTSSFPPFQKRSFYRVAPKIGTIFCTP